MGYWKNYLKTVDYNSQINQVLVYLYQVMVVLDLQYCILVCANVGTKVSAAFWRFDETPFLG
jgi:hypothetical protein